MIYTFYSFKGGVGRTMALANIAELFYQAGLKVLMVDWDMEAPGLERFFPVNFTEALRSPGIIDMLNDYKVRMGSDLSEPGDMENDIFPNIEKYILDVYPNKQTSEGNLWLLPAGKRFEKDFQKYANDVRSFDWQGFYKDWEGELFFSWLKNQFEQKADVVLIDSRTGVTEMGGVCIYQLADAVIMFCAPNHQNVAGIQEMARSIISPDTIALRNGHEIKFLIIPSRVEDRAETKLLNEFRNQFINEFEQYKPKDLESEIQSLWELKIPHVPYFSFNEVVAVREKSEIHSEDILISYRTILAAMSYLSPRGSIVRRLILPNQFATRERLFETSNREVTGIALWGPSGSGKDWLIRGFAKELQYFNQRDMDFRYELFVDDFGKQFPVLVEPPYPMSTPGAEDYLFRFSRVPVLNDQAHIISAHSHIINIHNDKGGNLLGFLLDNEAFQQTFQTLLDARFIIVLLDPTSVKFHETLSQKQFPIQDNIDSFVTNDNLFVDESPFLAINQQFTKSEYFRLLSLLFETISRKRDKEKRYIAICLTKMDKFNLRGDPWNLLNRIFGQEITQLIKKYQYSLNIEVFSTSAAGYVNLQNSHISNEENGRIKYPDRWNPINTASPFFWLFEQKERELLQKPGFLFRKNLNQYIGYPRPYVF
jgi:MinD-like ATPase involved in chromosome partitioning or flagellar assembly